MWAWGTCFWKETWTQTPFLGTRAYCLHVWPSFRDPCTCPFLPSASPTALALVLPPLLPQVAELQEGVKTQCQEQAILQRSLQDKAAEVEVERMGAKVSV